MDKVANVRLANRVIWALEDIGAHSIHAQTMLDKATTRARLKCDDPALLLALAQLRSDITEIRLLAVTARQGEYAGARHLDEAEDDNA